MYFSLWVCNTVIGTVVVDGRTVTSSIASRVAGRCGESFEMIVSCDREEG